MTTRPAHPVLAAFAAFRDAHRSRREAKAALRDDMAAIWSAMSTAYPAPPKGAHWDRLRAIALGGGPAAWRRATISGLASDAWRSTKVFWLAHREGPVAIEDMSETDKDQTIRHQQLHITMLSLAIRLGNPWGVVRDPSPDDLRIATTADLPKHTEDLDPIDYDRMTPAMRGLCRALNGTGVLRTIGYEQEGGGFVAPSLGFEAPGAVSQAIARLLAAAHRDGHLYHCWDLKGRWCRRQSGWRMIWHISTTAPWFGFFGPWAKRGVLADLAWMEVHLPAAIQPATD